MPEFGEQVDDEVSDEFKGIHSFILIKCLLGSVWFVVSSVRPEACISSDFIWMLGTVVSSEVIGFHNSLVTCWV